MESSVDGDIRLSVGIDTKKAESGVSSIGKSVQDIIKAIEKSTGDLSSKFDTLNNAVTNISTSLDEMKGYITNFSNIQFPVEQLNKIIESISAINNQAGSTEQEVEKANESAVKLSDTVTKIGQTRINLGAEDLQSRFEAAEQEYQRLESLYIGAKANNAPLEKQNDMLTQLDKAADEIFRLEDALKITQTTMTNFDNSSGEISAKMLNLQANVNKAESAVIALEQKLAQMYLAKIPTQEFEILSQEIEKARSEADLGFSAARDKLVQLQGQARKMIEEGKAFKDVTQTTGYQNLVSQLQVANGKLSEARRKLEERTQAENADTEAVNRNTEAVTRNNRARSGGTGGGTGGTTGTNTRKQENTLTRIATLAGRVTSRVGGFASTLSRFFGRLSSLTNKSRKDTDKSFKDVNKSINRGITNLLKYALGIRSVYFAFNKLRRAGIESFKSLVKSSDEVNKTISETYSAFINLKNAIGPAFQPLVSAVAPILTKFADSLTNVTYKLGEFFAAIRGQSYVYKAIKVQKDYAKSLENTSDKLQENLASFDKLNVLSDKSEKSDSDKVEYETKPLSDTFNTLKSLIESQDWEGLGSYIADKINTAVQKINDAISWDNIGDTVTGTVTAFTTTVNSLVSNINWALIGKTVGEGVNTIVNTFDLLLTGIDWVKMGVSLATSLNNMVSTINWTKLGKTIGDWFMKSWRIFLGFVKNLDFKAIGKAFADGISGFFNSFDLSLIASAIATFVNGISDTLLTFVEETDWGKVVDNIAGGINTLLYETDWGKLAKGLSKLATTLLDALIEIIGAIDWQQFGTALIDFIAGIDWAGLFNNLFKAIGAILGGIEGIIVGIWNNLTQAQESFWDKQFAEAGGNIGRGLLNGIVKIFSDIGYWIWDNIFIPFYDGVCKAFGIHSPSTVMAEIGEYIIQGLFNGLKEKFVAIWDWLKSLPKKFKDGFLKIVDAIKQPFIHIADWFKNVFRKAWEGVRNVFSAGGKIFDGIKEGIANVFKSVVNTLIRGINTIIAMPFNNINGMLNVIRQIPGFGFINENPLPVPQIPELAQGTVIPANFGKFPAILGDNKKEPEIVSPLSTVEQAVENALNRVGFSGGGTFEINLNVDGKVLYKTVVRQDEMEKKRHGGRSRLGTV